jgi:hypothetical protein
VREDLERARNGTQFVDALVLAVNNSSGLDLAGKKAELVTEYNAGITQTDARARVVVKLIEYPEYRQVEFVLAGSAEYTGA